VNKPVGKSVTLLDLARALNLSTATVHRALYDHDSVRPATKARVRKVAQELGYRPNLAARFLKSNRGFRISVNTLQGTTSFWDEVRSGITHEAESPSVQNVELEFRTYPRLGEGEEEAFGEALAANADGIITFPTRPQALMQWMRRAPKSKVPVICVATDAPGSGRQAVVSVDTMVSGSLAADLLGKFLQGVGKVAVTLSAMGIQEHAEKCHAFESTLRSLYPQMKLVGTIEEHDVEAEAYDKCRKLFKAHPDLAGMYVTTEASIPVLEAARDANMMEQLTVITTDLFPALIPEIRSGAVEATIYQRPRTLGRMAFRLLQEYLVDGECSSKHLMLSPHLVMRGNLDFFLQRKSTEAESNGNSHKTHADSEV
jgi:LacI family transcriptional regulator